MKNLPVVVFNGRAGTRPSYRAVVVRQQGDVRFVEGTINEGATYERGSFQIAYPNDIIIQRVWFSLKKESKLVGWLFNGERNLPLSVDKLDYHYEKMTQVLKDFLTPNGYGPSYLPDGPWWRGGIMNQYVNPNTRESLEEFFAGVEDEWKDFIIEEALKSPAKYVLTDWTRAKPIPELLKNTTYLWTSEDGSEQYANNSSVWILYHDNGSIEVRDIDPTKGTHCIGPSRKIKLHFDGQPIPMPKSVLRAIRVNLGAFEADNLSYGAKFYLHVN